MSQGSPAQVGAAERARGLGAGWGAEAWRGERARDQSRWQRRPEELWPTAIRNCVTLDGRAEDVGTLVHQQRTGHVGQRPAAGLCHVGQGGRFLWLPCTISAITKTRHFKGERTDLAGKITIPDILIQAAFGAARHGVLYRRPIPQGLPGAMLSSPCTDRGNRANRTGYKVVRAIMKDGRPTGEYEDFMTGGWSPATRCVWARPVGIAVAHDGALTDQ